MITKPIDFTNCHPEIAEALKQGLSVKCKVGYDKKCIEIAYVEYFDGSDVLYRTDSGDWYEYAEPVKIKKVLRPIEESIPLLLQNGWRFDDSDNLCCPLTDYLICPSILQKNEMKEYNNKYLPDYLFQEIEI